MKKSIEIFLPVNNNNLVGHFVTGDILLHSIYTANSISFLLCYYQKEVNVAQLVLKCLNNYFKARYWEARSNRYHN